MPCSQTRLHIVGALRKETTFLLSLFQRSWIALLEKGVDFEYKEQDPYDKTPEFLAINPRGLVPALVHDNQVVIESGIINGKILACLCLCDFYLHVSINKLLCRSVRPSAHPYTTDAVVYTPCLLNYDLPHPLRHPLYRPHPSMVKTLNLA